jgi:PPOX class probable F420-dependent enzyme
VDLKKARAFLSDRHQGILATIRRDGRPQLSSVLYFLDDDGRIKISTRQPTAKVHNLRRDGRAALHVTGQNFYQYIVVEGTVQLVEGDGILPELRRYYRRVAGEHPDWADYDVAMIREERLLLSISIDRAYGMVP